MTNRILAAAEPVFRQMAIGMNPRLYEMYSVDHKRGLITHLQSRGAPLLFDGRTSSSGVGCHKYQPPVVGEPSMPFPHLSHPNDSGLVSGSASARVVVSDTNLAFLPHDGPFRP